MLITTALTTHSTHKAFSVNKPTYYQYVRALNFTFLQQGSYNVHSYHN